jgi:pimeloyl-ACP methyl ester carboxylesterase
MTQERYIRPMGTFVLVHGAWSGAHGFRHVRRQLQAAGHDAFTPSLTGIGERAHLTSPQVTLGTHVQDVVNHVLFEDLDDIVLLGFSYGGMVVTGSLLHIADRVRHLVYLDAFVPADGDSLESLAGLPGAGAMGVSGDWLVPPVPRSYDDAGEAAFMTARRVGHPRACFSEPVRLERPLEEYPFERTYIRASADAPDAPAAHVFEAAAAHAHTSSAWHAHEIASNHMLASNRPAELTALLLGMCA